MPRRARYLRDATTRTIRPVLWLAGMVTVTALGGYLMTPAAEASSPARAKPRHATAFSGTPAVGALFYRSGDKLGGHFCTASVVHSPAKNLLITAAHCVTGRTLADVIFAPGYHGSRFPRGQWIVRREYVNNGWAKHKNPNDDVAFLVVGRRGTRVERHTGAEELMTGQPARQVVQVVGYPDSTSRPVTCRGPTYALRPRYLQLVFHCDGFTTGTSGGPFLAHVSRRTGTGWVVGVIGGYQGGGDTPSVSYSARFFSNIQALYKVAVAGSVASLTPGFTVTSGVGI